MGDSAHGAPSLTQVMSGDSAQYAAVVDPRMNSDAMGDSVQGAPSLTQVMSGDSAHYAAVVDPRVD